MSNFLAIATVTEVLRSLLDEATAGSVTELQIDVTTDRPDAINTDDGRAHVNLFLYQVMPNPAWRNAHVPTRRGDGGLIDRPLAALDLRYLLTFAGDGGRQVAERLMGAALAELEARPQLSRNHIREVIQAQQISKPFLALSDLADQPELVKLTQLPLDLEELSKLWSVFFQVPYCLSVAYEASVVLVEAVSAPQSPLPVRGPVPPEGHDGRNLYVDPLSLPEIERLEPEVAAIGSTLRIHGRNLVGELTEVALEGLTVGALPDDPTSLLIELPLSTPPVPAEALRAGIRTVQVVHPKLLGTPPEPHRGVESNVAPFVLRPSLVAVTLENPAPDVDGTRSGELRIEFDPPVGKTQRVTVMLNELVTASPPAPPPNRPPRAYSFDAPSRNLPLEPDSVTEIVIPFTRVRPDDYLVRVRVDGATSELGLGSLPATPTIVQYVSPAVEIP
ncbi:MAG: DUF4255 domain-containing protein [Acidobacteria bacterium]|nr:DUF4255 domain-containing protein [Acidobacteriota bacterium]